MPQLSRTQPSALALALALTLAGCADLTAPGPGAPPAEPEAKPDVKVEVVNPQPAAPTPPPPAAEEQIGASHVLIMYKGSMRAPAEVTRTKDQAKQIAVETLVRVKRGADFDAIAKQYSDEPGAKVRAGKLGKFSRSAMVKPFSDAAFALKPGETSGIVETDFGFHIIKRTE
jgi:hypothetical protein